VDNAVKKENAMTMRRFTLRDTSEAAYNFRMWRGDLHTKATEITMQDPDR
jgi:hypothetical protein